MFKEAKLGITERLEGWYDFDWALVSAGISLNELSAKIPVKHKVEYYHDYLGEPGKWKMQDKMA